MEILSFFIGFASGFAFCWLICRQVIRSWKAAVEEWKVYSRELKRYGKL